jgi:hypothetical protein
MPHVWSRIRPGNTITSRLILQTKGLPVGYFLAVDGGKSQVYDVKIGRLTPFLWPYFCCLSDQSKERIAPFGPESLLVYFLSVI